VGFGLVYEERIGFWGIFEVSGKNILGGGTMGHEEGK
jgi:hypothetical protein